MHSVQVTVLVASYNPSWEKMRATLASVLMQTEIYHELIIVDDGSRKDLFQEIIDYLEMNAFKEYRLIKNMQNVGTIQNILSGVKIAKGKYLKLLSPGDCLFNTNVLNEWVEFMKNRDALLSFGDYVAYSPNNLNICKTVMRPQVPYIYTNKYSQGKKWKSSILLKDNPIGACWLSDTKITLDYLNELSASCKYAEDMMYRLMLARGIDVAYYHNITIWYEYGDGVSTSNNEKWLRLIKKDMLASNNLILSNNSLSRFDNFRLRMFIKQNGKMNILKYILFPEIIFMSFKKNRKVRYSNITVDNSNLIELFEV